MPGQYQYLPPPPKRPFWTKGKAALALVVVIVVAIAVVGVVQNMPYLKEGSSLIVGFTQSMLKDGDNNTVVTKSNSVVFPWVILNVQTNRSCSLVFNTIKDHVVEVRQKASPNDKVWTPTGGSANTLKTIEAYTTYYVKVDQDCTLELYVPQLPHA